MTGGGTKRVVPSDGGDADAPVPSVGRSADWEACEAPPCATSDGSSPVSDGHNASVANEQLEMSSAAPTTATRDLFNAMPANTTCFDFVSAYRGRKPFY